MSGRPWAVVASRTGPEAKSRLAAALAPEDRSALAAAMLRDVLHALEGAGLGGIVAVLDPGAPLSAGALVVPDPGAGLNAAVAAGVSAATGAGAGSVLVVPGDVPLLQPEDLAALVLAIPAARAVVVGLDRHGSGTNALLLRPGDVIAPAFGPGSAARHLAAAERAGAAGRGVTLDRVALDVDTADDLRELLRRGVGGDTGAVLKDTQIVRAIG